MKKAIMADFILFPGPIPGNINIFYDTCQTLKKKYIFFPFYEEMQWRIHALHFLNDMAIGFYPDNQSYVSSMNDELIEFMNFKIRRKPAYENCLFNFVNSKHEARELMKDYPNVLTECVRLSCGMIQGKSMSYRKDILDLTGLKRGEYILQVGRLSLRKNQLASILATNGLKIPLVFIFSEYNPDYLRIFLKTVVRMNIQAPIFFVTSCANIKVIKNITLIHCKTSDNLLTSAYQNAGLHLHPAFYECPGYTYLEAAKLAVPTVASSWSTLREYLSNDDGSFAFDEGIKFVRPDDINGLAEAIKNMFGKKFTRPDLPIFKRTDDDVQREMGLLIDRYMS